MSGVVNSVPAASAVADGVYGARAAARAGAVPAAAAGRLRAGPALPAAPRAAIQRRAAGFQLLLPQGKTALERYGLDYAGPFFGQRLAAGFQDILASF